VWKPKKIDSRDSFPYQRKKRTASSFKGIATAQFPDLSGWFGFAGFICAQSGYRIAY
jgi:hypothetical protein